ncbi:hypothetical protein [Nonomuraea endophytica]|uniref:hypothetical protein n=1 Tax=Nonomuraea endophytica TaxID=714136 RepID=UPI0037CB8A24
MAGQLCVGPCNDKVRKVWAEFLSARNAHADELDRWVREGGEGEPPEEPVMPEVRWRPGDPLVCGQCRATARRALLEVDSLASVVAARSDGFRPPSKWSRVSGSRPKPEMSPDAVLLDELLADLLWYEDQARAVLNYAYRPEGARGSAMRSRSVAWLVDHLEPVLAAAPAGPRDLVKGVLGWERRLRSMVGDEPPGWTPARCRCGDRNLHWDRSVGYFVCGACGNHVSGAEERGLVAEEAG